MEADAVEDGVEFYIEKRFAGRGATAKCLAAFKEAGIERVSDLKMFNYDELQKLGVPPLFIKLMQRDGLLDKEDNLRGLQREDRLLDAVSQVIEEKLKVVTPTALTLGLKDSLVGERVLSREDYNYSGEIMIFERFRKVDVAERLEQFKKKLKPWKELAASFETRKRKEKEEEVQAKSKRKKAKTEQAAEVEVEPEDMGDEEQTLQLGVNEGISHLPAPPNWYFDTSQGGMALSNDKPDCVFSACQYLVSWLCAVFVGELKWEFDTTERKKCIGQVVTRLRKIIATQKGRTSAFGFIADRHVIQFVGLDVSSGTETFWWSREYPFHSDAEDDTGFKLLLQMIYADQTLHGYGSPMGMQDIKLEDGRLIRNICAISFKGESISLDKACHVFTGTLDGEAVVIKVCPDVDKELRTLMSIQGISGVLQLLVSGKWNDGRSFIVIPFRQSFDGLVHVSGDEYLRLLAQLAETIERLSQRDVYHADLSAGNIVFDDERFYLIDFGSAQSRFQQTEGSYQQKRATRAFAALQVLDGNGHCLSSELESLFYVVIHLALQGKEPWRNLLSSADVLHMYKKAVFQDERTFALKILTHVGHEALQAALERLRRLFFQPGYRTDVTFLEFSAAVQQ